MRKKQYQKLMLGGVLFSFGQLNYAAVPLVVTDAKQAYQLDQKSLIHNIKAGTLTQAINQYAQKTGVLLIFDPTLTQGKVSKGLKGQYGLAEGFSKLLQGSGLFVVDNAKGDFELKKSSKVESKETNLNLEEVQVRAKRFYEVGPLPGLGLTKEQIPGNVQSITAKEIKESRALSMGELFNKKLQSVTVNDYQGNPFQMDVQYRGFTAGPQIGTPQGLSVFFDGIRVNEPFGDVVNWDMIPMNAIAGVDVFPGSNPVFGLNTLGGAFTLKTKDGFNNAGVDVDVLTGSYGRKQLQIEGGVNNGTFALFGAGNIFLEDGWRDNSPSEVNQFFGKASYRGEKLDLNLSTLLVETDLVGNGLLPSEEYARDRNSVYSSEDTTNNRLQQFQLAANYFVNDTFTITGQVYRRNSKRHQVGADVFADHEQDALARRRLANGEQYTCLLDDSNNDGIPDYYVYTLENPSDGFNTDLFSNPFVLDALINNNVNPALLLASQPTAFNKELPSDLQDFVRRSFNQERNYVQSLLFNRDIDVIPPAPVTPYSFGQPSYGMESWALGSLGAGDSQIAPGQFFSNYYYTIDSSNVVSKNYVLFVAPNNNDNCTATQASQATNDGGAGALSQLAPDGTPLLIDGFGNGAGGVVEGTPTAVFTDNQIDQTVDGASIQFNWNVDKHKFMIGASVDAASADYKNTQQLGFLDASRKAFLAPDLAHPQFGGADVALANNDFGGTNTTKSVYFSETWTPVDAWNFNVSGRYNATKTKNKVATRYGRGVFSIGDLVAYPDLFALCPNGDCTNVPTGFKTPDLSTVLNEAETEEFSYYSFNPSLGATWQAKENLNIYANWAQGTRTPSVIELGCALDKTPVAVGDQGDTMFKSIVENRQCSLPTSLSGDPYLPQIKATTYDIGLRGTFNNLLGATDLQWNLGAYQTNLKDDIYFIAVGAGQGFFDTVGKTRRRGIEAGLSGKKNKWGFSVNYGLTDATFEDNFFMFSADNSSATTVSGLGDGAIEVQPGSRMPGVPLHNLNASVSYEVTPKWQMGLSAIVHSESFMRGNENNEHEKGVTQYRQVFVDGAVITAPRQPTTNPGKLPGYATFNFQTRYQLNSEWSASMLINNVFDKEFFSAGRLGRNPFSPSIQGNIGPEGYNHNSGDWRSTNFIAPSAPRGVWFSLNWQFDPDSK